MYENQSMGVFDEEEDEDDVEAKFGDPDRAGKPKTTTSYISYHARKQLAFDMWCELGPNIVRSEGSLTRKLLLAPQG